MYKGALYLLPLTLPRLYGPVMKPHCLHVFGSKKCITRQVGRVTDGLTSAKSAGSYWSCVTETVERQCGLCQSNAYN